MENDTKNVLMQYLFRFAEHYEIPNTGLISFKKRSELLDKLKEKDNDAATVITALFDAFIKADRIANDKEKYDKARVLWDAEHAAADKEKVDAEMLLIKFCKANSIAVGGLALKE
ncbi:hypothetical protein [Aurantibacillus circumpalustris]|uniref:hypothetical protein n=1 Tax=Aurantibacillus circumpalustris TaxID=3036359 RepID=UPI00295B8B21|nr:hypothetical protein [Aurantibacillus circumpalustris]